MKNEKQTKGGVRRMARERNPERNKAREIWLESAGNLTAKEVAEKTGVKPEQVRKWKSMDKWQATLEEQVPKRKRGGQPGNRNATGAGAPFGNSNAESHGAYSAVHLADLSPDKRAYIESITLDTASNMLRELQLLMAKEEDLKGKIRALENGEASALYVDKEIEMLVPESDERLNAQREQLEAFVKEHDNLIWDIEVGGKPATKQQQNKQNKLERDIAELQDKVSDSAQERDGKGVAFKTNMKTIIKASPFDRAMKLEAELNKTHGRIIKLLDSIKSYELEDRRIRLEERKYNLAKQKLTGAYEVNPETGEIDDENDEILHDLDPETP